MTGETPEVATAARSPGAETGSGKASPQMAISINGNIPGGSIDVVDATDPSNIKLRLVQDVGSMFKAYYHFRAIGVRGIDCTYHLIDAGETLAARLHSHRDLENRWTNTGPVASYDRRRWFRVPGTFDGQVFTFRHRPDHDACYYASWAPYSLQDLHDLLARAQTSPRVRLSSIGRSAEGADIDMLTVGSPASGKKKIWVIAGQHPSETQSGYFLEGLVGRMLDEHDPVVRRILDLAMVYIVPNMNPDGTKQARHRTNARGANLNREWTSPSLERSPEVVHVRTLMERVGVDFCLDCHADAELRCNFLGGPLEIPSRSERLRTLFRQFEHGWAAASPDYEVGHPYPGGSPETADLTMAWNWIAERFDCLSVLLEQPFKDTSWWQDKVQGWSPERAKRFGASLPAAIYAVLDSLR
ncbi:MAG: M14-type cytosolic carboxypeptidase [Hyphomicrobiales bacterium]